MPDVGINHLFIPNHILYNHNQETSATMVQTVKNILFIGATGLLGSQILHAILDKKVFTVKVLARADTLVAKKDKLDEFRAKGAEVVQGDVANLEELTKAAQGVDTIVSVISGPALFGGQESNIVKAAKAVGAKRIVPSRYGADVLAIPRPNIYEVKSKVLDEIKEAGLEYTLIATGAFYEFWYSPAVGFAASSGKVTLLGDGNQKISSTLTSDIAKFVPEILLDPHSKNQVIRLSGETLTQNQAVAIYEQVSGKKLDVSYKSLAEIQAEKPNPEAPFVPLLLATVLQHPDSSNFEGKSDNWRYPQIVPVSVKEFFQQQLKQ